MRILKNCRGAAATVPERHLTSRVGLKCLLISMALLASSGAALASPQQPTRQPALRAVDDRGLLDSVADRGQQLISNVRDGASSVVDNVRDNAGGLIDSAMNFLGVRYKLGGNSAETGFDCSGFTRYVFENSIGHILPHRADEQANDPNLTKVAQKDLKPGDLVFFNTMRRTFSHVGIYLGDGKFIHSPRTGESVRIEDINIAYWARHFTGARRVPELAAGNTAGLDADQIEKLAEQATHASGGTSTAAAAVVAPMLSASLNPSGLKIGSTLPLLPERALVGFAPTHEPYARALADR